MKKLGILGGMSYESTLHYYDRINSQVNEIVGGLVTPEILLTSVNFGDFRKWMLEENWDKIELELLKRANYLQLSGANYIAIATNTMHKVAPYIASNLRIPLIHIGDSVSDKCKRDGITKVGLLGTKYTMTEDFIKSRLDQNGLEVVIPGSKEEIDEIDRIIFDELCKGKIKDSSKHYYVKSIDKMVEEKGIKGVILGCTEIEMLLKEKDTSIPLFDTTQAHIDDLVDYVLERKVRY